VTSAAKQLREDVRLWPRDDVAEDEVLCLNFVNTVSWRGKPHPDEYLPDVRAWLGWIREESLLSPEAWASLEERAEADGDEAQAAHARAIEFREAAYRLLLAATRREEPSAADRLLVTDVLRRALFRLRLAPDEGGWSLQFEPGAAEWEAALHPIALSLAQLLTGRWLERLRACERDECLWLFLDQTKNRSRKWCDMGTCGNVVKARRSYARKKAASVRPSR
jgi:predicted RNA-binding Zn ribbon-like protein